MTLYARGALLAAIGTIFYGLLGLAIKFTGEYAGFWHIMAGRGLVGLLMVIATAKFLGVRLSNGQTPGMLLTATANFGASALITLALTTIPIFEALVLWYLLPAWTTILAARFLGDKISRVGIFCTCLAISGAVVVLWPQDGQMGSSLSWGHLAGLCSALSAAVAFVLIRHHSNQHGLAHFFHFCLVTLICSCAIVILRSDPVLPPSTALNGILLIGLLGGIGQMMIFASVAYMPPAGVTIICMGEIVVAAIGAYFLFDERLTLNMFCGGVMIVGAGLGINLYTAYLARRLQSLRTPGEQARE